LSERLPEARRSAPTMNYDVQAFVQGLKARRIEAHVAINGNGEQERQRRARSPSRARSRRACYAISQRLRKRIEECFGWGKTVARD
jgi:hypothetical protein